MTPGLSDRITTREHRALRGLCALIILAVGWRRIEELSEAGSILAALALIGLFAALFAAEPGLSRRSEWSRRIYFALQFLLVQALALFQEYQDTWALLYAVLAIQAAVRCPRREALAWAGVFAASTVLTLALAFGPLSGLGRAAAFLVIAAILVLYDSQFAQREDAAEESRILLAELQLAHARLSADAARAEESATASERDRILRTVHDSIGQKVFAIQLAAESALLLADDPRQAAGPLGLLQNQTQSALDQMRQLIEEWKPG